MTLHTNTLRLIGRVLIIPVLMVATSSCPGLSGGSSSDQPAADPDVRGCSTNFDLATETTNRHICTLRTGRTPIDSRRLYCGVGWKATVEQGTPKAVKAYRCDRTAPRDDGRPSGPKVTA